MDNRRHFLTRGTWMLAGGAVWGRGIDASPTVASIPTDAVPTDSISTDSGLGDTAIRVGLIGCGRRGTRAAMEVLSTVGPVRLTAMGDLFADNLQRGYRTLNGKHRDQLDTDQRRFTGDDAFERVLACDIDVVLLASPPVFRPTHFAAAIDAHKHVFMERPLAVDAIGLRNIVETGKLAEKRQLSVSVGFQRRFDAKFIAAMQQIQDGALGDPVSAEFACPMPKNPLCPRGKRTRQEQQIRSWRANPWASGHALLEAFADDLNTIDWWLGTPPADVSLTSDGVRFQYGHVCVTARHGDDIQSPKLILSGTAGRCDLQRGVILDTRDQVIWRYQPSQGCPRAWQRQQNHFIAQLRSGHRVDNLDSSTNATMAALLGCRWLA